MASKAVLQEALQSFPGTTFVVSHDRHFLNPVVNKILEIQPGSCRTFPGNLEDYLWKIDQEQARGNSAASGPANTANKGQALSATPVAPENPRERRRRQAQLQQKRAPLKKKLQQLEEEIATLESGIAARETEMADKAFFEQGETTASRMREYEEWKIRLSGAMEEWESTAANLEALEAEDS